MVSSLKVIDDLKRIVDEVRNSIIGLIFEVSSASVIAVKIASRCAVVRLKIDRFKPVDALINDGLTSSATSSDGKTIFIAATEVLITSKALKSGVALWGDTRPAGLDLELGIELVEETLGGRIALGIIVPTVSGIGNERLAEIKTLTSSSSGKVVAVLTTSEEGDGEGGVGTRDSGKEGGGELSRMLRSSGNVNVALEGVIIVTTTAIEFTSPSGLIGTFVIADSDEDSISIDDLSSEADGLLASGDSSKVVVGVVSIKSGDLVGIGRDVSVLRVLFEDNVISDGDVGMVLRDGSDGKIVRGRAPSARINGDGTRIISSAT